jgi:alkylation response protein AidB-like acyl-CoA dehydrogenase
MDSMAAEKPGDPGPIEARQVAEDAREREWKNASFLRELFLGRFRLDLIHPFPEEPPERPVFRAFSERLDRFLSERVDADRIDREGKIPAELVRELAEMGAFGLKISEEYGGLGFTQLEYSRILERIARVDGSLVALLSAHQSIGVPQPLKLFGTEAQKRRYLPRLARGAVSAFALTETDVGSDPANLSTTAARTPEGNYVLDGEKLWTTNGTIAELFVVMARHPDTRKISAFIVEAAWPGVEVVQRCHFMGLKAIENGVIRFRSVRVPKENLLWEEGKGLKLALITLNTGRLTLPASSLGSAKVCLRICREWASRRVQWGQPIGRHEAVAQPIAEMASSVFAMEAISVLASAMADAGDRDIRLEAAVAKMWNTEEGWRIIDRTLQIRGGRGYETADSLRARGEPAIPVERILRDSRINTIFEGSSEIMRLFIAREALDRHLQAAGDLVDPRAPLRRRIAAAPRMLAFYAGWYPSRWLGWGRWPRFSAFGPLAGHVRFVDRESRRLARAIFHAMVRFGPGLEKKQATLFRAVDAGADLFAMSAALARAQSLRGRMDPRSASVRELCDLFCRGARRRIRARFRALSSNDDARTYRCARRVLAGEHGWLEEERAPSRPQS